MALEIQHKISENDGCKSWNFTDETGDYNVTTNPTGYGYPNMSSSAITLATIYILPHNYTVGFLFTFTIVSNTITVVTITFPDGTVTDITSLLASTVFPFIENVNPFAIIGDWLGYGIDSEIISSAYYIEYNVSDGTNTYTSSSDEIIVCQVCCCVRNAEADLDSTDCECQNDKIEKTMRSAIFLDSAIWAMENGDVEKSYTNLMTAKELCSGKCSNC